ncbi:MAG: lytic transglycosylase domain-containing protein [Bdellovibrionota bacterium]
MNKLSLGLLYVCVFFTCTKCVSQTPVGTNDLQPTFIETWSGQRPWTPPNYLSQDKALGYSHLAFVPPEALRPRINFWKRVYSEISSKEGFVHDTEEPFTVFQVMNLNDIYNNADLTPRQKEKQIDNRIEDAKKKFASQKGIPEERIRFQRGLKDRFHRAIYVSGRYLQEFEKIFTEQGVPRELTRLIFVESSFNVMARSKVGASGLWQIMPSLGRSHRMISKQIDQRNDPFAATVAAAKILRSNYNMLGSWPLAITAYNHGPTGVKKLVATYNTTDLAELVRIGNSRRSFAFASKNFYASFAAALEVEKEADKYFKPAIWAQAIEVKKMNFAQIPKKAKLLEYFNGDESHFLQFNPHLVETRHHRKNVSFPHYVYIPNPVAKVPARPTILLEQPAVAENLAQPVVITPVVPVMEVAAVPSVNTEMVNSVENTRVPTASIETSLPETPLVSIGSEGPSVQDSITQNEDIQSPSILNSRFPAALQFN